MGKIRNHRGKILRTALRPFVSSEQLKRHLGEVNATRTSRIWGEETCAPPPHCHEIAAIAKWSRI